MSTLRRHRKNIWINEIDDLIRGACGGFLFGIPLLYTMEVWWIGSIVTPPMMLAAIASTFIIVFLLNRTAGFRKAENIKASDALIDTVEAIAIGVICTALLLVLLQEINGQTPLDEAVGKLIYESMPFTLGVALANQFLSGDPNQEEKSSSQKGPKSRKQADLNATLSDIGGTLIGSIFIAFNIAPTDEVVMLAAAISAPWLLMIIAASLLISYGIVFEAGFANQKKRMQQKGIFQRPLSETVMSYLVSLLAAAIMLFFFHQLTFDDPWSLWLRYSLVLGLPSTIGGAAGRLAV
ncbi:MAG TPA: TIGR02587 family membrane protein [Crinalium sp.]|jgi:putative integral membrane protein (TIGR02587 family)